MTALKTICDRCKEKYNKGSRAKNNICSKCKKDPIYKKEINRSKHNEDSPDDWVECKICELRGSNLSFHLMMKHNLTPTEYSEKYQESAYSKKYRNNCSEKIKGDKNPGYQHGGRLSAFSRKFKNYKTAEQADAGTAAVKIKSSKTHKAGASHRTLQYWLNTGLNEEDAKRALSKQQRTFSKDICIEKYGEEEGLKVWQDRQVRWLKNYKKSNFSKISQELFHNIIKEFDNLETIYFATLYRPGDEGKKNCELVLKLEDSITIKPDFIDTASKKIIEFNGDYWHSVNKANPQREKKRTAAIYKSGYSLLEIAEFEYRKDPNRVLQECIKFLTL